MSVKRSLVNQIVTMCPGLQPGGCKATKNTIAQYKDHTIKFAKWCKDQYGCRTYEEITANIVRYLNSYSKWLEGKGKTASTIHTYIAGCCAAWQIPMELIPKPLRHCYEITRSRGVKASDSRREAKRDASPRLYDLAECVGIRRHEYLALHGNNFKHDESGYPCVEVTKGKNGKYQLQRILPKHVDFVESYFSGSNEYVFTKKEMKNKIDLHHLRAIVAQEAYQYYLNRLNSEPGYRNQLEREIEARWRRFRNSPDKRCRENKSKSRAWDIKKVRGIYYLRGENRAAAEKNGFSVSYDRCAVMAVSIFHLSHWRCNVAINHYLLAK